MNPQLPDYDESTGRKLLQKSELKDGAYYLGRCRNATIARWNATEQYFYHWREKFNAIFIETIKHPSDEDHFDVFRPVQELSDPKFEIPFQSSIFKGVKEDLQEYNVEMWKRNSNYVKETLELSE